MKTKVAIQGYIGSYHHEAANIYLGNDIEIVECDTFKTLAKSLAKGKVDKAIMAIENTIAGAILPNYALLTKYNLKVVPLSKSLVTFIFPLMASIWFLVIKRPIPRASELP